MASANKLGGFMLIMLVVVSVLGTIAVLQVSSSITRPIHKLQQGVNIIGGGDLDYQVGTDANDEIGRLSRAFDRMTANLKTITASKDELEIEIQKRMEAESSLRSSLLTLDKRVKELDCLYNMSRLVEIKESSIQNILQGTLELILNSFQEPRQLGASIALNDQTAQTAKFQQTPWQIQEKIQIAGEIKGCLIVGYLSAPANKQAPFTTEEEKLIHAMAERLGLIVERRQAEQALIRSEQRFRTLVEHSLTAISIVQDDQIIYQNPEQEKLLGPLPRPIIFNDQSRLHPDDAAAITKAYCNFRSGKAATLDINFRVLDTDNSGPKRRLIHLHGHISRIEYRDKEALLVNLMDLTEVKNLEKLLIIQDKMASLGRVAAGIAHEIRNPLSGINIYIDTLEKMIERQAAIEKIKTVFEPIQSASAKIESVIRRVMDFAKPAEPTFVPTDIRKPIEEALVLAAASLRKEEISVETIFQDDLPQCEVDPHQFEEIILNFINNASDALKNAPGEKKLRIAADVEGDLMVLRFSDSGPGVAIHMREEIFEPFFTTKPDSTGIGLSLCQRIITDHGGNLHVETSALGGAEFIIKIPLKR
jgi:PAS domain S-box-containing protein